MKAYILAKTGDGLSVYKTEIEELYEVLEVKNAQRVFGPFDVVMEIEADDEFLLGDIVAKIRNLPYIKATTTLILEEEE